MSFSVHANFQDFQRQIVCQQELVIAANIALRPIAETHNNAYFDGIRDYMNEVRGEISLEAMAQLRAMEANMNRNLHGLDEVTGIFSKEWQVIETAAQARVAGLLGEVPVNPEAYTANFSRPLTQFPFESVNDLEPDFEDDLRAMQIWTISHTVFGAKQMVEEIIKERMAQILDSARYPNGAVNPVQEARLAPITFGRTPKKRAEAILVYRQPAETQDLAVEFLNSEEFADLPTVVIANESEPFHIASEELRKRESLIRAAFLPRGKLGSVYFNCESVHILGGGLPFLLPPDIHRILESALPTHKDVTLHFYLAKSFGLVSAPEGSDLEILELADQDDDEIWTPEREAAFDQIFSNLGEEGEGFSAPENTPASVYNPDGELESDGSRWLRLNYLKRKQLLTDHALDLLEFPTQSPFRRGDLTWMHTNDTHFEIRFEIHWNGELRTITLEYLF